MAQFKIDAELIGVKVITNADEVLDKLSREGRRAVAGFDPETGTIYLRKGATDFDAFHEMTHAQQWKARGHEAYQAQGTLMKEFHVFATILEEAKRNPNRFSQDDLVKALDYIKDLIKEFENEQIN